VIAAALGSRRDDLVLATKWGNTYDERSRALTGPDASVGYARRALEASLRRLETDRVDLWQLHPGEVTPAQAEDLVALCEDLVAEGKIRGYGWSTDEPEKARLFAAGDHCTLAQHELNLLEDNPAMLAVCEEHDLASINRSTLAMGLLSDRMTADTVLPADDVRTTSPEWLRWFTGGRPTPDFLRRRDAVRDVLTGQGRTLAQGAVAWVLARSPRTLPIVGIRTVAQATENLGTLTMPPLTAQEFGQIEALLRPDLASTAR
jgi:aryl-alcohol dehydrogenase-like predicted oxidoreductase